MKMHLITRYAVIKATQSLFEAKNVFNRAQQEFDREAQLAVPSAGYGRDAMVRHIHADAAFGHQCPDLVVSRVLNAFGRNGEVVLRIQLGKVKGPLGTHYAFLKLEDVKDLVTASKKAYL